jgi:cytochrome o ubiquinol oxidase subunit 2
MSGKTKIKLLVLAACALAAGVGIYLYTADVPVLQPRGVIAQKERSLIYLAFGLSMIVVIPVYIMLVAFAWKFRESNPDAVYRPDFVHSRKLETAWWGIPMVIIFTLGIFAWRSSHQLDPFRQISPGTQQLSIQAISLDWKWLFIYPKQGVASVNFVQLPINTPIDFQITSDAPMNSFWVPQLGGQIYAMSGMATHLHLMADAAGTYYGSSANISGAGFAGMHFNVRAGSETDFQNWVSQLRQSPQALTTASYNQLAAPSSNDPVRYYGRAQAGLFNDVIAKYEAPVYFKPAESL